MEEIDSVSPTLRHFSVLGEGLAKLHQVTNVYFGLEHDNHIGLNPQLNTPHDDWGVFFHERRLKFQVDLVKSVDVRLKLQRILERNSPTLVDFLNDHKPRPSLLHGDLWSGNVLYSKDDVYLIDPSVHFGDRECDLAMTALFGGFDPVFYQRYAEINPLPQGSSRRMVIYQLYHYLNHYNIFGSSYLGKVLEGFQFIDEL